MCRAENCRCERAGSASRTPSLDAAAMGDALVVFTGGPPRVVADERTPFTRRSRGARIMRASTAPLFRKGMPQAQAQCFAPGWIYAGETFDFAWRRLAGPRFACGRGGDAGSAHPRER